MKEKQMKYKRLAVMIEADNGEMYQCALSKDQMKQVAAFIISLHEGSIKVRDEKYAMTFLDTKKKKYETKNT